MTSKSFSVLLCCFVVLTLCALSETQITFTPVTSLLSDWNFEGPSTAWTGSVDRRNDFGLEGSFHNRIDFSSSSGVLKQCISAPGQNTFFRLQFLAVGGSSGQNLTVRVFRSEDTVYSIGAVYTQDIVSPASSRVQYDIPFRLPLSELDTEICVEFTITASTLRLDAVVFVVNNPAQFIPQNILSNPSFESTFSTATFPTDISNVVTGVWYGVDRVSGQSIAGSASGRIENSDGAQQCVSSTGLENEAIRLQFYQLILDEIVTIEILYDDTSMQIFTPSVPNVNAYINKWYLYDFTLDLPATSTAENICFKFLSPNNDLDSFIISLDLCEDVVCTGGTVDCDEEICIAGTCTFVPLTCPFDNIRCTVGTCSAGECSDVPDDSLCPADSFDCTEEICTSTGCIYREDDSDCTSDGIGCTDELCSEFIGCYISYDDTDCSDDDGIGCTIPECTDTGCIEDPTDSACTDPPCGFATCSSTGCVNTTTCSPGVCDATAVCTAGVCNRTPKCPENDTDPCTTRRCDSSDGTCFLEDCDDGDACTTDSCDTGVGCENIPVDCDDNNFCTTDSCDPDSTAGDPCSHTSITCNDGNPCTSDSCNPQVGCVFNLIDCDDNNVCTTNQCNPSITVGDPCFYVAKPPCNDNNPCTTDTCDAINGCVFTGTTCNDFNACTTDSCDALRGCRFTPITCNDNNDCTSDSCDTTSGCLYTQITTGVCTVTCGTAADCNDNNLCTTDTCVSGNCVLTPINCDDSNQCTFDSCVNGIGCVYSPSGLCSGGGASGGRPNAAGNFADTVNRKRGFFTDEFFNRF